MGAANTNGARCAGNNSDEGHGQLDAPDPLTADVEPDPAYAVDQPDLDDDDLEDAPDDSPGDGSLVEHMRSAGRPLQGRKL